MSSQQIVSLDAVKEFDRVSVHYGKIWVGEQFIRWAKLLYNHPLFVVLSNGLTSPNFCTQRGTRQNCPLPPLLAIEPLAKALKLNHNIHALVTIHRHHKITFYADDVLIFITKREISISNLTDTISNFSVFSGYKIHFSKMNKSKSINPKLCALQMVLNRLCSSGIIYHP